MNFQVSDEKWYVPLEKFPNEIYENKDETIFRCRKKAKELLETESEAVHKKQRESDVGDSKWFRSMLNSGTLTDKIAAMTSLVQTDAVHNIDMVEELLSMANKKGKREAQLAIHSLRELFIEWILPDRPLRYFSQQPLENEEVNDSMLVLFYYEHLIKQKYTEFLELLKKYSFDTQSFFKKIANTTIYMLLVSKPEQETILLTMLVQKLSDSDNTISSHIVHLLLQLVHEHPYMREVVATEVRQLIVQSDTGIRTIFYGITFLNQIEFTVEDKEFAGSLIHFYFSLFNKYSVLTVEYDKKQKSKKRMNRKSQKKAKLEKKMVGESNETRLKLLSAILTGINRALPYGEVSEEEMTNQENSLYRIVHFNNWSCSVQAMLLLYSLTQSHRIDSYFILHRLANHVNRFYRVLYSQLLSPLFVRSSKNNLFLNLLYRVLKNCKDEKVLFGLMKRVLQCCLMMNAAMSCGLLFLVSSVLKERGDVKINGELKELMENGSFDGLVTEEVKEIVKKVKKEEKKKEEEVKEEEVKEEKKEEEVKEEEVKEEEEGDDEVADLDEDFFEQEEEEEKEEEKDEDEDEEEEEKEEKEEEKEEKEDEEDEEEKEEEEQQQEETKQETNELIPPVKYNIAARDPGYSNSIETLLYELVLLTHHYHPTVAHFATLLLNNMSIQCNGDPLRDYSNKAFLDKFAYKHAKQRDIENAKKGNSSAMQRKQQPLSLTQQPVNTEEFLKQKEEDIAVEDRFFYQFFKEKARREVGHKHNKKVEDEDEDEDAMDRFAEDLAEEMMNQRVGSEDDDFLDDFEENENGRFLEEGEDVDMSSENDMDIEEDDDDDEGMDDDHMIVDEIEKKKNKKSNKTKSIYASAEEFEKMLAANAEETEQQRQQHQQRRSQKRKFEGKRGGGNKRRKGK